MASKAMVRRSDKAHPSRHGETRTGVVGYRPQSVVAVHDLAAAIIAIRRYVVASVGLAAGLINRKGRSGEGIVGATHTPL
jgi:hypothetical protein